MSKTRQEKEAIVARLKDALARATSVVFAEQSGLTMKDMEQLRDRARASGITVTVAKKTLATIAAKEAGMEGVDATALPNSVMTVIGCDDEVEPARLVADFARAHETVRIVGGVFEGVYADAARMITLSQLPSKPTLYARFVGTLNAPISGFATVLSGSMRGLVTVLHRIQEQKA